ncbi:MAG: hypothetical protein HZC54_10720 [Verrucomicrobia bacterium]|nr:hypothetical protein [Verrucomicrobiota bacterium]
MSEAKDASLCREDVSLLNKDALSFKEDASSWRKDVSWFNKDALSKGEDASLLKEDASSVTEDVLSKAGKTRSKAEDVFSTGDERCSEDQLRVGRGEELLEEVAEAGTPEMPGVGGFGDTELVGKLVVGRRPCNENERLVFASGVVVVNSQAARCDARLDENVSGANADG